MFTYNLNKKENGYNTLSNIDIEKIENMIELLTLKNYNKEIDKILKEYQIMVAQEKHYKTTKQKHYGIFYTNYEIAYKITEEAFNYFDKDINDTLFFEPCVGLGIFVITYLDYIEKNFNNYIIDKIINNIYIADIDNEAISLATKLIQKFIYIKFNKDIKLKKDNIYIGDILLDKLYNIKNIYNLYKKNIKFDLILTNPPYRNIKANKKEFSNEDYEKYRTYCSYFSKSIKRHLKYQQGTINLYKVFMELILELYTTNSACIGIIIPYSILSDKSTIKLRETIIKYTNINKIYYLEEKSKQFNKITQAMCFFGLKKSCNNINDTIKLINYENKKQFFSINFNKLKLIDTNLSFIKINNLANQILIKIHTYKKLKELKNIKNLRGELDLTLDKKYILNNKTNFMLLQGKNIKDWFFVDNHYFVDNKFIYSKNSEKLNDIKYERLACQQISNCNTNKRLKFVKVPKNIILANSCNYILSYDIDINYLLGLFNSYLFDWRFQLFSSNNHINNYELDDLPINICERDRIIEYVKKILDGNKDYIVNLNKLVFAIYGLTKNEIEEVMKNYNDLYAQKIRESINE